MGEGDRLDEDNVRQCHGVHCRGVVVVEKRKGKCKW